MISSLEKRILDSLSPKTVDFVRSLSRKNLGAEKEHIVGVRNEDLIYFLSCVEQGWMPIKEHLFRSKSSESTHYLFLSANPDSTLLQREVPAYITELRRYLSDEDGGATFSGACLKSSRLYDDIGKIQAIYRQLRELGTDIRKLLKKYRSHYDFRFREKGDSETTLPELGEEFFSRLAESFFDNGEIQSRISRDENIFSFPRRFRELFLLRQHVNSSVSNKQLIEIFQGFSDRGSILVGFSDHLLKHYTWGTDHPFAHMATEIGVHVPSKRLSLDASVLVGFEPLGTHEDGVLKYLGVL